MKDNAGGQAELLRLIVEEVDEAHDILTLAEQLHPLLPVKSFNELVRKAGGKPMRFRDTEFDLETLRSHLPNLLFPVEDTKALVERIGHIVRALPDGFGVDAHSEGGERRRLRARGQLGPGVGRIPTGGLTAIAIDPRAPLQDLAVKGQVAS